MDDSKHLANEIPHTSMDHTSPSIHKDSFNDRFGDYTNYDGTTAPSDTYSGAELRMRQENDIQSAARAQRTGSAASRRGVLEGKDRMGEYNGSLVY